MGETGNLHPYNFEAQNLLLFIATAETYFIFFSFSLTLWDIVMDSKQPIHIKLQHIMVLATMRITMKWKKC